MRVGEIWSIRWGIGWVQITELHVENNVEMVVYCFPHDKGCDCGFCFGKFPTWPEHEKMTREKFISQYYRDHEREKEFNEGG